MTLRRILSAGLVVLATVVLAAPSSVSAFADGDGSPDDPYQIATCADLAKIDDSVGATTGAYLAKSFVLTNNIDCTGVAFTPLASGSKYFSGTLDGGGHSLQNLAVTCTAGECGLFARLTGTSVSIKNLTMVGTTITGSQNNVGSLVGYCLATVCGALFEDVRATGLSVSGGTFVGGLVGNCENCTFRRVSTAGAVTGTSTVGGITGRLGKAAAVKAILVDSSSSATVTGTETTGGLVGYMERSSYNAAEGLLSGSSSSGAVSTSGIRTGGLVGILSYIAIMNSSFTGSVTADEWAGGLVGYGSWGPITVHRSWTTGSVTQTDRASCGGRAGGLFGDASSTVITESFSTSTVTGFCWTGGLVGSATQVDISDSYFAGMLKQEGTGGSGGSGFGGLIGLVNNSGVKTYRNSYAAFTTTNQTTMTFRGLTGARASNTQIPTCTAVAWDKDLTVLGTSDANCGSSPGRSTSVMKTESTFTALSWDFTPGTGIWSIDPAINNGYPYLSHVGGQALAAPTVELSAVSATSTSRNIQFRLTATTGQIDCSMVSATDGVDFDLTNIVSITVAQTSSTECTISAVSTVSADGATGTSTLAKASSFSVSYTGSAAQTNISSGAPASVVVTIPAASTTTSTTTTTTTTTTSTTTTTTATSPTTTSSTTTAVPSGVSSATTTTAPAAGAGTTVTTSPGVVPVANPDGNPTGAPSSPQTGGAASPATTAPARGGVNAPTAVAGAGTAPTTPTTEPPAEPTQTTTTVSAVTTSTLSVLDVPAVSKGGGALTIGGQRVEATLTRENNQLILEAGPIVARISALKREGGRAPLDADGRIRMMTGDSVEVEVTGFGASTEVEVRLYSEPTLLGRSGVSAEGQLLASYEIPDGVSDGDHTVVLAGESSEREELVFALSVAIGEPGDGASWFTIFVVVPLGLAAVGALIIPAVLRRRREEQPA